MNLYLVKCNRPTKYTTQEIRYIFVFYFTEKVF